MRPQLIKIAFISVFTVIAPVLTFAGSQRDAGPQPRSDQAQTETVTQTAEQQQVYKDYAGFVPAPKTVVQGEISRDEAAQLPGCVVYRHHTCPNGDDTQAFKK